jgi:putative hemolysin
VADEDLRSIPATGPVVVVANHPFGMLEGAILGTLLSRIRPDVKTMANCLLAGIPELRPHCIFVDPFQLDGSSAVNYRAMRESIAWLGRGGMLVVFPAGEVAHWSIRRGEVADPAWSTNIARMIRTTGAASLPVFVRGGNSAGFHVLGLIHPWVRTAGLPRELLNKSGQVIHMRIGTAIPNRTIAEIEGDGAAAHYLRWRTHLLAHRDEDNHRLVPRLLKPGSVRALQPPAETTPRAAMIDEISQLGDKQCLEESREYAIFLARAQQIPHVLREIGRLREISFRAVGEGTGNAVDLDDFDYYYQHLFLWNRHKGEVVGAYRFADTREVLPAFGIGGLYTSTLFHFDRRFFTRLGPALELGRSFVRPEYQKQFAPLMMLWKGIGSHVAANPETPVLFGAVSISNAYCRASRQLIVQYVTQHPGSPELARLVRARRPFRPGLLVHPDLKAVAAHCTDLEAVSAPVSDLERDGKGLPVLLRQYWRLGANVLGFNLDSTFSDALDGLMVVDLRKTAPQVLERHMGAEGCASFLRHQSAATPQ